MTSLEDDREIRNVLYRYRRGVDRRDLELARACSGPDAVDDRHDGAAARRHADEARN